MVFGWSHQEDDLSFLPFLCGRGDDFQEKTAIPREIRVGAGNKQARSEVSSMAMAQRRTGWRQKHVGQQARHGVDRRGALERVSWTGTGFIRI
jgi:hypothetical protein